MPDQRGLARTRADQAIGSRKGQTFRADTVVIPNAELPFEHLPHLLAERELFDLRFDRRLLTAYQASHRPTVADLCCIRPELEGSVRYHAERNSSASPVDNPEQLFCSLRDNFVVLFTPLALKLLSH